MIVRSCRENPKNSFAEKSSKEFLEFTHMPLIYTKHPGKTLELAM
jgi:hypothetical protein